jgi:pimeloyl-ACP methyl ester carboxylesterase
MDIILVPGFWLDGSSWSGVTPPLVEAGHQIHALTLPGLEAKDANRSGIGLRDHINAVVEAIDGIEGPLVLVGHSGGGAIIHGAVDERPDRVARAVYVDSGPLGEGGVINDELPSEGDEIPLPAWDVFDDADLTDLDDGLRETSAHVPSRNPRPWHATSSTFTTCAATRSPPPSLPASSRPPC